MVIQDKQIAILGTFDHPAGGSTYGHPSHQGFAETIGADAIPFSVPSRILENRFTNATFLSDILTYATWDVPEYDIYITGGTSTLYSAPRIKSLYPDSTLIYQGSDPFLYGQNIHLFSQAKMPSGLKYFDRKAHVFMLRRIARKHVDGLIAMSEFVADFVRVFLKGGTPSQIAHPYIQPDKYELLDNLQPDLSANDAVFIGAWSPDFKGIDILVRAWPIVREEYPDARLTIVGNVSPEEYPEVEGVDYTGFISPEKFRDVLESKSLYIHPARAEAFGVSVLEAMHAGLPAIVTNTTGARSIVREISNSMVVDPTPEAIASCAIEYFSYDQTERKELSHQAREQTHCFDSASKKQEFEIAFRSLINQIERSVPPQQT